MATPADQRLLELLDKWLASLDLHITYASLDDDSYWQIQPWSEHQRPTRWLLDLARQKTLALRTQVQQRIESGDATFSDALELMTFLANLVGSEHIERFIPVADANSERAIKRGITEAAPADTATGTREMPQYLAPRRDAAPAGTTQVARTERKNAAAAKSAKTPATKSTAPAAKHKGGAQARPSADADVDAARDLVIADAVRLAQWGRKWYELPELIARMADRPPLPEVRRILKENKSAIDKQTAAR